MAVDETEFSEFFASQYGPLCWLGLLLTGDRAEGEELAQEALVRTWWRWKLVRRPRRPRQLRPPGAGQPAPLAAAPGGGGDPIPGAVAARTL